MAKTEPQTDMVGGGGESGMGDGRGWRGDGRGGVLSAIDGGV